MGRNLPVLPFEIKKDNEFLSRRGKFSPQVKFIEDRVDEFKGVITFFEFLTTILIKFSMIAIIMIYNILKT